MKPFSFLSKKQLYRLALLGVLLLGFALRVYRLNHQELWGDEGDKLAVVNGDFARVFAPDLDVHPRLFHVALFGWYQFFGLNVFGLRLLPAFFGLLGLPVIYVLARRLFASPAAARLAIFILALSPFHIAYSQDLTAYSLFFLTVTLSTYMLIRMLAEPQKLTWWAAYVGATLLALHTHYYAAFALVAQNVFVLVWRRPIFWRWVTAQAVITVGIVPWLIWHFAVLSGRAAQQPQPLTLNALGEIITRGGIALTVGLTFPATWNWLAAGYMLLMLGAVLWLWRSSQTRKAGWLLGLSLCLPPLLVWVLTPWLQRFNERFLIMCLPSAILLLGWLGTRLPGRTWGAALARLAVAATSLAALYGWYYDPAFLKSRYGEMMTLIGQMAQPGDVLLVSGPGQATLFELYHPASVDYKFVSPNSVSTPEAAERDFPGLVTGYHRAWLVMYGDPMAYDPHHNAEAWLGSHAYKAFFQSYVGYSVTLYGLPAGDTPPGLKPLEAQFTAGPRLIGYAIEPAAPRAGQPIYVTLQWLAAEPIAADYTVFTHVLDGNGAFVAGSDSQPVSGTRPMTTWKTGEALADNYALLLPADLAAGDYMIEVGVYDLATMTRLVVAQPGGAFDQSDHLLLGPVRIGR